MIMMNNGGKIQVVDLYVATGVFFILTFGYFFFSGKYVLAFQETQFVFVFSGEYLHQHLLKPGALLEYAARFLMQFYTGRFTGSIILSAVLTLPAFLILSINKRLFPGISNAAPILMLIPSSLLLVLQANYYHMMEHNLGILVILLFYLVSISSAKKYHLVIVLILFPVVYYLAGAYISIFTAMYIVHKLFFEKERAGYIYSLLVLLVAAITFLISWKVIFYQPVQQFILFPLPLLESSSYRVTTIVLAGFIVFYPLICRKAVRLNHIRLNKRIYFLSSVLIIFVFTVLLLYRTYNPQTARVVELQRLIFNEKWNEAIKFQEKYPSRNLIGQYFYNYALSETDQLCDRLFSSEQDFLAGALILPWGNEHLNRGAYFYYAIGLINEAHRWAYEEMVVYGYRPQNIKLLAKTSLINGDYAFARKYINILKKTIYYRKWAIEFEKMADNPGLIASHPELGPKLKILPKNNFFILFNEPQNNLALILEGQPDNRKAIEYYLAGLLLTKKVEIAVNNIKNMKGSGYTHIPRNMEEAVMIYYNSTGVFPDLGGLSISQDTQVRFKQYFAAYLSARNSPATLKEKMQKRFGDTFWYYFHFK
jgi:hypothetical protein